MKDGIESWRGRLAEVVAKSGRSLREISLASGFAPGYLHSVLKDGKDPSIENAIRLCRELGISLSYLLYGIEISPETEELLSLLEKNPQARAGILQILRDRQQP